MKKIKVKIIVEEASLEETKELLNDLEVLSEKYSFGFSSVDSNAETENYKKRLKKLTGLEW